LALAAIVWPAIVSTPVVASALEISFPPLDIVRFSFASSASEPVLVPLGPGFQLVASQIVISQSPSGGGQLSLTLESKNPAIEKIENGTVLIFPICCSRIHPDLQVRFVDIDLGHDFSSSILASLRDGPDVVINGPFPSFHFPPSDAECVAKTSAHFFGCMASLPDLGWFQEGVSDFPLGDLDGNGTEDVLGLFASNLQLGRPLKERPAPFGDLFLYPGSKLVMDGCIDGFSLPELTCAGPGFSAASLTGGQDGSPVFGATFSTPSPASLWMLAANALLILLILRARTRA